MGTSEQTAPFRIKSESNIHIDGVFRGSVLRNGEEDRLMIGSGVDGGQFVDAGRKSLGNIRGEDAIDRSAVQALEERKPLQVIRGRLRERGEQLHDDVRVAPDQALSVQLLGRRIVVLLCVDEITSLQVLNRHRDREGRVGPERSKVGRERELARGHEVPGDDFPHDGGVAGPRPDLIPVGDGLASAKVDEVVAGCKRSDLTRCWGRLSILQEARYDLTDVEC